MNKNFAGNVGSGGREHIGQTPNVLDPLLTSREVASFLGIGHSTVWHWVSDGILPSPLKLGHLSRWRQSTIERVIDKAELAAREVA